VVPPLLPVPPPAVVLVVLGPPVTLVVGSSGSVPDAPELPQPPIIRAMTSMNAIVSGCLGLSFMAPTSPYPPGAMVRLARLWVNEIFVTVSR
jgi:hypothetical protein